MTLTESQNLAAEVKRIRSIFPMIQRICFTESPICKIDNQPIQKGEVAHVHREVGVLCVSRYDIGNKIASLWDNNMPTSTLLHEVAHIMTLDSVGDAHGKEWQSTYNVLRIEWGYMPINNPTTYD